MIDLTERTSPLTFADAVHLLRRTTMHPTWAAATALVGKTPAGAVDQLLAVQEPDPQPPSWADTPPEFTDFAAAARLWPELQRWWADTLLTKTSLRERMVMLWHNTFTSDYITVYAGQWMVKQQQLIRTQAFSYRALAEGMVADPGMLRYLNGDQSIKGNPNENFAREWFELFTLGVGNYTEKDIVEAARAFTGWRISGLRGVYNRSLADLDTKTILNQTGKWEWQDVARITFEQPACARWVAGKLLRQFVAFYPSDEDIEALAVHIRTSNFELKPVLRALLTSNGFYAPELRGALIKSPADLVVGLAAVLNATTMNRPYALSSMGRLTQELFYPPTVQGWQGHHAWITSSTFPQRQRYAESFIDGKQAGVATPITTVSGTPLEPDVIAFVRQMPGSDDAHKVVDAVASLLLPIPITKEQHEVLLEILLAGARDYEWDLNEPASVQRVKFLLRAIVRMPEFQLM